MTQGRHITPEKRAELRAILATGINTAEAGRRAGVHKDTARAERRRMLAAAIAKPAEPSAAKEKPEPPPADPVEVTRLRARLQSVSAERDAALKRAVKAEDLRRGVLGILNEPVEPVAFRSDDPARPSCGETIVLYLSDLHWGERVDMAAMDGLNSYSLPIARARLDRYFRAVADLATKHWSGPPPERIILILGGDLVSGEIHAELAKTNEAKALPAVKDLSSHLGTGIRYLRARVCCPIDIIEIGGNHGRSTLKPESKESVETSYDTLVADFLEMALSTEPGVRFYVPASVDALFSVYGWRVLATHGDRIGSRGGQGFIGPAATAARGMKRLVADYAARGVHLDLILLGHFHTALQLEEGFVNGSLPGPTEYSRDGRFRPQPAQQLFLALHPRRGISQIRWVRVGHESEGALYAPPPETRELRPRWRTPGVTIEDVA